VLDLLNRCFVTMSEIIFRNHGTIDKFMGDSILVLFEASRGDAVKNAVTCAVDMQCAMEAFNAVNRAQGLPDLYFGIGINTGRVMSALLGSDLYSEYTVIGDEVNLASRIESFSLRGQVLISESTWERCQDYVRCGEPMDVFVKGRSQARRAARGARDPFARTQRAAPGIPPQPARAGEAAIHLSHGRDRGRGAGVALGAHPRYRLPRRARRDRGRACAVLEIVLAFDLPLVGQKLEASTARS
jgi:hypothetical protein